MSTIQEQLTDALSERYSVLRELGRGGMATVFLADDLKLGRQVAIKVLHPELASSVGADRFLREIRTTAGLQHPHILTLHESGEADGLLYFVMPYVDGQSLRDRLMFERQLPVEEALGIVREIGDALAYAHDQGMIHRDVKPENILLSRGHAILADFGVAKALSDAGGGHRLTSMGSAVGTFAYMSPEQASGSTTLDGRSDQYALACVLYELLAGEPPFTGPTGEAIARQHVTRDPPAVSSIRGAIAEPLSQAIQKALAKTPADRFRGIRELLDTVAPTTSYVTQGSDSSTHAARVVPPARWRWVVTAAALAVAGTWLFLASRGGGPSESEVATAPSGSSIAVLPFQNVSGNPEDEYFSDGLAEELLNALAKVPNLRVAARSASFSFRESAEGAQSIGSSLGVSNVLEGSVRRAGDRVRISAQLVSVADGFSVWSESYERELDDIFAVQDEISQSIVRELRMPLAAGVGAALVQAGTSSREAHDAYLKGRYHWRRQSEESSMAAIEQFDRAIELDPSYAQAHAGRAITYVFLPTFTFARDPLSAYAEAESSAAKAIELDPGLSDAHLALALVQLISRHDWEGSGSSLRQAIALNPSNAEAHIRLSQWYNFQARFDETMDEIRIARQLDPLNLEIAMEEASMLFDHGDPSEGIQLMRELVELAPAFGSGWAQLGGMYMLSGQWEEAGAALRRFAELVGLDTSHMDAFMEAAERYGTTGEPQTAPAALVNNPMMGAGFVATIMLFVGQNDAALDLLEEAYEVRAPHILWVNVQEQYDVIRDDPRFQALVRKIGLDPRARVN